MNTAHFTADPFSRSLFAKTFSPHRSQNSFLAASRPAQPSRDDSGRKDCCAQMTRPASKFIGRCGEQPKKLSREQLNTKEDHRNHNAFIEAKPITSLQMI